jgi:hypothetical protein
MNRTKRRINRDKRDGRMVRFWILDFGLKKRVLLFGESPRKGAKSAKVPDEC